MDQVRGAIVKSLSWAVYKTVQIDYIVNIQFQIVASKEISQGNF